MRKRAGGYKIVGAIGIALMFGTGCTVRATQLRNVTLSQTWSAPADQQKKTSILIHPFTDLRGAQFSKTTPVPFVWYGEHYDYPEASYILKGAGAGGTTALVGELGQSLPYLIAAHVRSSRLTPNVNLLEELTLTTPPATYAIHLHGRIRQWSCGGGMNLLPGIVLGYVGIPFGYRTMTADIEVDVVDGKSGKVKATHRYTDRKSHLYSLYYNIVGAQDLALRTLDTVLNAMMQDLAKDV